MRFHIGDVLSVISGRLVSPDLMSGLHRFLDYMTGDQLFTHQLPRAMRVCAETLRERYPHLAEVEIPDDVGRRHLEWLALVVKAHGETVDVDPLPGGVWMRRDPIAELEEMVGPQRTLVVVEAPQGPEQPS